MNPKPFFSLNHFTVPLTTVLTSYEKCSFGPTSQVTTLVKDVLPWYKTDLRTTWAMFGESIILVKSFVNRSIEPTAEGCRARKLASRTGVIQKRRDRQGRSGERGHATAPAKLGR